MAIRHFLSHLVKHPSLCDLPPISSSSSSKLSTCSLFPAPRPLHLHLPPRRPYFPSSSSSTSSSSSSTRTHAAYSSAAQGWTEEHSSSRGGSGWTGGGLEGRRRSEESNKQTTSWTTLDGRRKLRGFKPRQPEEFIRLDEEEVLLDPWPSEPTRGTNDLGPPPPPRHHPSRSTPPPLQPHPFQSRPSQPASSRTEPQDTIVPLPTTTTTHLDLTPPSAHPVNSPLVPPSLESYLESLLSWPTISLDGLGISSTDFSLALQLLGTQTSSFSTLEMEEESTLTLDEVNGFNKRRELCARMVLKMAGERDVVLSAADEYWVARARLQLGSSISAIPRSSYSFSSDGTLSLHLPFFQTLLSSTSTRLQAFEAVQHFTHLLPRLSSLVEVENHPILPRQDVLTILDLILERCRTLNDVHPLDLILPALLTRRDERDQGVSFFVRRILQTFDGSSPTTKLHSMAVYTKIIDHDASSYLGSAALCQFGLSLSDFTDASRVLEDPQLSSRHFHLLAYRIVLAIERISSSSSESRRVYNASRLARPFRRMGADPSRPRRPLSVDLRDRIVNLLSRHRDKSVAAWIFLNHPTIPVASSSSSSSNTIIIDLDPSSSSSTSESLPPSPIQFAPLPLSLAEQLLLILCQRRREEDLLLAISILQTIPPKDQTIKLYNLLLRHTFLVLWNRNEADALSSLLYSLLASSPNSTLRPNLQTLEAQLLAPGKSFDLKSRRRSDEEKNEVASFRRAAFDGFFALVMERGGQFRRRTWELLVGAVSKECGYEKGKEAVGWMRLAGFEPDEEGTTWGEQVLRKVDAWDNAHNPEVGIQELVVDLMDTEGMKHGRPTYTALLERVVHSNLGTSKNHLRHLFITDFVARSFPGTSWITLESVPPASSFEMPAATSPSSEPIIDVFRKSSPTQIHLTLNVNPKHRPLPPHLLRASTSAASSPSPTTLYPSMHDLQPPSNWADWEPPSSAGGFSFERDAMPMLSMLLGRFKKDGDHEFVEIVHLCLQHGRVEELRRKKEVEGLDWWEGGWEWEDEWRDERTRREGRLNDGLCLVE